MIDNSAIHILVVDDEPFMLTINAHVLAKLGYSAVTVCEGAVRALELIDQSAKPPDIILLDLNMPGMDGLELVRHLVKRSYPGSLILLSGEDERILQAAAKLVQAHHIVMLGYLRKPIKSELLAELLAKWKPAVVEKGRPPLDMSKSTKPTRIYSGEEVRSAIANSELVNYYQPMISLTTGHVVGMETLVRWRHPVDGLVFPDQFIGVAEAHGLICDLSRYVITAALTQVASWRRETGLALQIAVNVSMDDLKELDFADYVGKAATATGVAPKDVTLEVTESRLAQDLRGPLEVLTRLQLKRFRLAIDDFGTGHSSLTQLRDLPFNELKIDRGFVHRAWADEKVRAMFSTSVNLAKQLQMQIVAEGVEDQADWDFVRHSGCDVAQGYFISRPIPAAGLQQCLKDWNGRALIYT